MNRGHYDPRRILLLCAVISLSSGHAAPSETVPATELMPHGQNVAPYDVDADGRLETIFLERLLSSANPHAVALFAVVDDNGGVMVYLSNYCGPNVYYGWEDVLVDQLQLETMLDRIVTEYPHMLPSDQARADRALSFQPGAAPPRATGLPGLDALQISLRDIWELRQKLAAGGYLEGGGVGAEYGFSVYASRADDTASSMPWFFGAYLLDADGQEVSDKLGIKFDPQVGSYVNYTEYMLKHDPNWEGGNTRPAAWQPELSKLRGGTFARLRTVDGRVVVPMRAVAEALHGSVLWDGDRRVACVTIRGNAAVLDPVRQRMTLNGVVKPLDASIVVLGGHIYVSLGAMSAMVGSPAIASEKRMLAYIGPRE